MDSIGYQTGNLLDQSLVGPESPPPLFERLSSTLEGILRDEEMSPARRLFMATWVELCSLFSLADPVVVVYLLNSIVSMWTLIMCGHLGNCRYAAASLANNGIQIFVHGLMGIWAGMIRGTLIQTLILIWSTYRTDWRKEVESAKNRLDIWDEKKEPLLN